MQKVSELTEPPVVGKFYLVPCAEGDYYTHPIIPIWHDDIEIGITDSHYHRDVRFISDEDLEPMSERYWGLGREVATMGNILRSCTDGPLLITWHRRKCRREMPIMSPVRNFVALESKYVGRKALCGKCPHRGFSLESLPQDENGLVICNGHGLAIDMKKGEVVKRAIKIAG